MKDVQEEVMEKIQPCDKQKKYVQIDYPQKRRKGQKSQTYTELEFFKDLEDMEIDVLEQIPNWVAIRLAKRRALAKELAREGSIIF